jgi:hypothetical protein
VKQFAVQDDTDRNRSRHRYCHLRFGAIANRSWSEKIRVVGGDFGTVSLHFWNVQPYLIRYKCTLFVLRVNGPSQARELGCEGVHFKLDARYSNSMPAR